MSDQEPEVAIRIQTTATTFTWTVRDETGIELSSPRFEF